MPVNADPLNMAWLDRVYGREDRDHKRPQIAHAIGWGVNEDDAEGQCRDVLLKLDAAVHCDEDIILTAHSAQQLAVLYPGTAAPDHRLHGVTAKFCGEIFW